jgi:L-2-hydroxyglutarate oxidase LhgO
LHVPSTAIIDFGRVAAEFARDFEDRGGHIRLNCKLRSIRQQPGGRVLDTTSGDIEATKLISCAGLWADRVAQMTATHRTDPTSDQRIVPFRGDYYTLRPRARHLVRGLIYPVPDPRYPFLGIHFTRRTDGEIWAGPNAVLAASRAGYRRLDVRPRDLVETIGFRGFRRLARNYWRTGISEIWRDISKPAFVRELQRYVPSIQGDDVRFGPSGVRAQAVGADGVLVDDFSLIEAADILHVCNAPSPAATASPAIGRELADRADRAFGLTA